jgi:hypothetical protein
VEGVVGVDGSLLPGVDVLVCGAKLDNKLHGDELKLDGSGMDVLASGASGQHSLSGNKLNADDSKSFLSLSLSLSLALFLFLFF